MRVDGTAAFRPGTGSRDLDAGATIRLFASIPTSTARSVRFLLAVDQQLAEVSGLGASLAPLVSLPSQTDTRWWYGAG